MNLLELFGIKPKTRIAFFTEDGTEVVYKEHIESEQMLVIETDTGLSKIPVSGLVKKTIKIR